MNTNVRKTCDELAEQGFIALAPDLCLASGPGVNLNVTSEVDWQPALVCAELPSEMRASRTSRTPSTQYATSQFVAAGLPSSAGSLGGLMVFLTADALRRRRRAAGGAARPTYLLERSMGLVRPFLCTWPRRTSSFLRLRKLRLKRHLPLNRTRPSTAIPAQNHAFSRHGGAHYNAEAPALAHERTYAFLNRQLQWLPDVTEVATVD